MSRRCGWIGVLLVAVLALPGSARAQAADGQAWAVAYVDVTTSGRDAAAGALRAYRNASLREGGAARVDVFEQAGWPGHFAVVEAWRDADALTAHAAASAAGRLRDALAPVRVSGYDERPYVSLAVAPSPAGGAVHIVSHVDIGGPGADEADAPGVLRRLAEASRAEAGNVRFDVLQHAERANHFTVVGSWESQAALDAHMAAAYTTQYRDTVQPITGSPLDERLYVRID